MSSQSGKSDIEVMVTGYGAFDRFDDNPAYLVVATLPQKLELDDGRKVILRVYPSPIKVGYKDVFEIVPQLYELYPEVKYFIHLGVNGNASEYRIERRGRKGPYNRKDVDGKVFAPPKGKAGKIWDDSPDEIATKVDVEAIINALHAEKKWNVKSSDDAGLYLCEFIYYNSLLTARKLKEEGRDIKGIFFHVPPGISSKEIKTGQDTLIRIVKEIVQ